MSINDLIQVLLRPDADAASVVRVLGGREIERQEGSGRRYAIDGDAQFASAFVGIDDKDGRATARYVELKAREGAVIRVAELLKDGGEWRRVPPTLDKPHRIVLIREGDARATHRVAVYASMSAEPDAPDARVESLLLVREPKP